MKDINENGLKFYLNHDASTETFGKYINHSKVHPNLTFKIFIMKDSTLDVIFFAKKKDFKRNRTLVELWQTILGGKGLH